MKNALRMGFQGQKHVQFLLVSDLLALCQLTGFMLVNVNVFFFFLMLVVFAFGRGWGRSSSRLSQDVLMPFGVVWVPKEALNSLSSGILRNILEVKESISWGLSGGISSFPKETKPTDVCQHLPVQVVFRGLLETNKESNQKHLQQKTHSKVIPKEKSTKQKISKKHPVTGRCLVSFFLFFGRDGATEEVDPTVALGCPLGTSAALQENVGKKTDKEQRGR